MATNIHPQALVSKKCQLADGVTVGAYATIGDNVTIGKGTVIDSFAQVLGHTQVGQECHIFSYAVVGNIPQDLKYKQGDVSYLFIGNNNRIREFVTINPGTEEGSKTTIGNDNLIMAYSHIAHDCIIGDGNIFANGATLAGYVHIEDKAVVGGLVAIHQFSRVGSFSVIGGCSKVVQDVPPYSMCDGHPAKIYGVNLVGLKRAGFSKETISALRKSFKVLFFQNHTLENARKVIEEEGPPAKEVESLLSFLSSSKRGVCK